MAKICAITGKGSKMAGKYSNRVRATKFNPSGMKRKQVNLQKKRIFVPELNKTVVVTISTQGLRTLNKNGAYKTLKAAGLVK
ncbi:MAG TPA: bL28 family ribosomal protein [Candidatus Paceibacterota bacterium]|jgi:large subunit ribosomal protein L28|nr:bL28 family ribosomal protein [Candidatus Paceibacterota bacterium]